MTWLRGNRVADPTTSLRPAAPSTPSTAPDTSGESGGVPAAVMDVLTPTDPAPPARPAGGWRALPTRLGRRLRAGWQAARQAVTAWPRRPYSRVVGPGLLIFMVVGASVLAGAFVVPALPTTIHRTFAPLDAAAGGEPGVPGSDLPGIDPSAAADGAATGTPTPGPDAVTRPSDLAAWARPLAAKLGIPLPAMQAYGYAELAAAASQPSCRLRWTTLAGIGKVESAHGQDHAVLAPDGAALPPIIGAPLDGQGGRMTVPDTDGGKLDLDHTWDHAVGPMQFIPATWASYGADADGNGVVDINNVNDAALAAARYLCAGNRNLSAAGDWWAAIMSYNAVQAYVRDVFNAANDYGVRSR
jgi:hypothetical protein